MIGSAAALRLAERCDGDVLQLEQYRLGHDRGASSDQRWRSQLALARELGVTCADETRVEGFDCNGVRIVVRTDRGTVEADHLTLATGSWAGELLPDFGLSWRITLTQEQVAYFAPARVREFAPVRFPIWVFHGADIHYGFPVYGEVVAELATSGASRHPVDIFRADRPALTEPGFPQTTRLSAAR